ncbi:antibiotic biosynthesis monooxygenase [Shewanella sp. Scap07]|uniref:putative quinol monooxygenase n=1 Tax=Shewanella sp. Scap07 TaxID=2589987 RepID=UPI0015C01603|nr:antibiotic biosynthesis monooxygenase [Shewanella sp. Scap07]QLE85490.1 antibiotic biosynthesis monooxygenase [Shewanella sp. Scap07]
MAKIVLQGYIMVPVADMDAVKRGLVLHSTLTRAEPGCIKFEVSPDDEIENRFNVYEVFDCQASFDHHQLRVKASNWGKISQNVSRHYQITCSE